MEQLRKQLKTTAEEVEDSFPENEDLRMENGEPVLQRLQRAPVPEQLRQIERLVSESISEVNILDALADTENWLNGHAVSARSRAMRPTRRLTNRVSLPEH